MPSLDISPRQRLTFLAHLYKAVARQHHREMLPLLSRYIGSDSVVIDVGAHAGQFAKLFAGIARHGKVYAFEPGTYTLAILRRVVKWRRIANIIIVPFGLSDEPGGADLALPVKKSGSLGFGLAHISTRQNLALDKTEQTRPLAIDHIRLTTLDDFAKSEGLQRIDFIKADIEGWEIRMLRGARQCLERFRPVVMLEVVETHLARAETNADEAWQILGGLGYRGFRMNAAGLEEAPRFQGDADYLFIAG